MAPDGDPTRLPAVTRWLDGNGLPLLFGPVAALKNEVGFQGYVLGAVPVPSGDAIGYLAIEDKLSNRYFVATRLGIGGYYNGLEVHYTTKATCCSDNTGNSDLYIRFTTPVPFSNLVDTQRLNGLSMMGFSQPGFWRAGTPEQAAAKQALPAVRALSAFGAVAASGDASGYDLPWFVNNVDIDPERIGELPYCSMIFFLGQPD